MSDQTAGSEKAGRPRVHWRVVGMLVVFCVLISGAVIVTDVLSVRDRHAGGAAATGSAPASQHVR